MCVSCIMMFLMVAVPFLCMRLPFPFSLVIALSVYSFVLGLQPSYLDIKRKCRKISIRLANDLGQHTLGHGLSCLLCGS